MFEASEALQKMEGMKKIKSTSFHQYSWNSEVETTWISLIGWHHKTSNKYVANVQIELLIEKLAIFAKKFDSFYSIGRIGKTFASETLSKINTTTNQVTISFLHFLWLTTKEVNHIWESCSPLCHTLYLKDKTIFSSIYILKYIHCSE